MQRFYSASTGGYYLEGVNKVLPDDAKSVSEELFLSLLGKEIEPDEDGLPREKAATQPTLQQRIDALQAVVDEHLNAAARKRRYESIHTAALRAGFPGPFHDEGLAFATWMDAVNAKCYEVLALYMAGQIPEPTSEQLLAMLPALNLPEIKGA